MVHAGVYSSVLNYLKAVEKSGTDDTAKVLAALKSTDIDDGLIKGAIRADEIAHAILFLASEEASYTNPKL